MGKEITKKETRVALTMLNAMNECDEEIRKDVVIDYVLNALGLEMVAEEKELREFLETDIKKVETPKAIKTFKKDEIEKVEMTIQEAVMQAKDLLNNLENEKETEIDVNDIVALRKILKERKKDMKPFRPIRLTFNNFNKIQPCLETLEKVGLIDEGEYSGLEIEIYSNQAL